MKCGFAQYLSPRRWLLASPAASAPWSIRGKGLADPSHGLSSDRPPYTNAYYRANFTVPRNMHTNEMRSEGGRLHGGQESRCISYDSNISLDVLYERQLMD